MSCDFVSLAPEGIRTLQPYCPGKPIEELQREFGLKDVIKLASNENPLGAGPRACEAVTASLGELGRYPDGNAFALKQALADRLSIAPDLLTIGNGSNDVLELLARVFVTPADEVVFSEHAFAVYALVTKAQGARAVVTPARDWGHDLSAMRAALTERTRIVFIANPNNPTGTWVGAKPLAAFIDTVPEDVLVVVDEAYFEYVEHANYPDCLPWVQRFPNLVVTRTFSKVHGLAALRVGYAVSQPMIAELLNRVRQPFNVNALAQIAAEAALQDGEHVQRSRALNREGLSQLTAAFEAFGLAYIPSVANFVAVDIGQPAAPVYEKLLREGVIVRPVDNYGMPNHLRVTVGLAEENARFLQALDTVLRA